MTATSGPNARIVFATVSGHGRNRVLRVRVRVSTRATATLRLLAHGVPQLTKRFTVKGGANVLDAPLPPGTAAGTRQVRITLVDATGARKSLTAAVPVPREGQAAPVTLRRHSRPVSGG